jgi:predicted Fe-S protein YdhL (DUF1289 family)
MPSKVNGRPHLPPIRHDRDGYIRCRVCGCTEREPCHPPCYWAEDDLCDGCQRAALAIAEWRDGARRANLSALLREVEIQASPRRPRVRGASS